MIFKPILNIKRLKNNIQLLFLISTVNRNLGWEVWNSQSYVTSHRSEVREKDSVLYNRQTFCLFLFLSIYLSLTRARHGTLQVSFCFKKKILTNPIPSHLPSKPSSVSPKLKFNDTLPAKKPTQYNLITASIFFFLFLLFF